MNEFQAWSKIIKQYENVEKLVRLNQDLYDQLHGSITYLKNCVDEVGLPLAKREQLNLMLERSDKIMDSFNEAIDRISAEKLQGDNSNSSAEDVPVPQLMC
jgi:hypothetical protein